MPSSSCKPSSRIKSRSEFEVSHAQTAVSQTSRCLAINEQYDQFVVDVSEFHHTLFAIPFVVAFLPLSANAALSCSQHYYEHAHCIGHTSTILTVESTPQSSISLLSSSIPKSTKSNPASPQVTETQQSKVSQLPLKPETKPAISVTSIPTKSQTTSTQQIAPPPPLPKLPANQSSSKEPPVQKIPTARFQPIEVKKITQENKIEVELVLQDRSGTIKIDRETFRKVKTAQPKFLQYLPSSMQPLISRQFQSLKVLKEIPDDQLFEASVLAGSLTEMIRSTLTYPLATVKARVQARRSVSVGKRRQRTLLRKLKVTWLMFFYETKRGNLFAGILPTLLIIVPASGVYSGVKEVSRRAISMGIQTQFFSYVFPQNGELAMYVKVLSVNLLSALIADVGSLAVRTPADVLALRRQVFGRSNVRSDYTDWAKDSFLLLPSMILTDLPYLMSRIFLNAAITTSGENLGRYEVETILIACLCAFLTTPFDVARTRILLPALPSEEATERRLMGSSKYRKERRQKLSVYSTMKHIASEGNGGVQNLFAGWLERTLYLGLGRAWLDPLRVIGYLGLRDAILLKLF